MNRDLFVNQTGLLIEMTRRFMIASLMMGTLAGCAEPMRGLFVFGHEVRTVRLCGETRTLWVQSTGGIRDRLQADYERLATRAYEEVYLEFDGRLSDEPGTGFAADYDGIIVIDGIRAMSRAGDNDCAAVGNVEPSGSRSDASAKTYVFVCPSATEYVVRTTANEAWVFRAAGTLQLPATDAPQGGAFSDGSFELRIDGEQAQVGSTGMLEVCQNDRRRAVWEKAKLDGADFRAVGNEPGWVLEIQEQARIVFVGDYGETRVELPLPRPTQDRDKRTAIWSVGELRLEVIGRSCSDTMSGEEFESEVVVTWQGRTLRGCGRALH